MKSCANLKLIQSPIDNTIVIFLKKFSLKFKIIDKKYGQNLKLKYQAISNYNKPLLGGYLLYELYYLSTALAEVPLNIVPYFSSKARPDDYGNIDVNILVCKEKKRKL